MSATSDGDATTDRAGPAPDQDAAAIALANQLLDLARAGSTAELVAYLDAGLAVNLADSTGSTLLLLAAYHGRTETVHALVSRGADVGRGNDRGQTPLAAAVFKDDAESVRLLVGAGADPAAGSPSAIDTAQFFGRQHLVPLLEQ